MLPAAEPKVTNPARLCQSRSAGGHAGISVAALRAPLYIPPTD
jgi:hypothetical protein